MSVKSKRNLSLAHRESWAKNPRQGFFGRRHTNTSKEKNRAAHAGQIPWNAGLKIITCGPCEVGCRCGKHQAWQTGLTKETDVRVAAMAKSCSDGRSSRKHRSWSCGLTKDTDPRVARMALSISKRWTNLRMRGEQWRDFSPKHRQDLREMVIKNMQSGLYSKRPNKTEAKLGQLLNELYPKQWKYVGYGGFRIGDKIPDFVNVNGFKAVIELFGDYWHKPEEERSRRAYFKKYGFSTLIIWSREIKNTNLVRGKIKAFCEKLGKYSGGVRK